MSNAPPCGGETRRPRIRTWYRGINRKKGHADLVAFGRHFLANPDLPRRIREGLSLNAYDRKTFYAFDFHGCTGNPFYAQTASA